MAYTIQKVNKQFKFKNVHGNYDEDFYALVRIYNDPQKEGFSAYNETTTSIQSVIKEAVDNNARVRACGTIWSLSKIPFVGDYQLFSRDEENVESMKFNYFLDNDDLKVNAEKDEYLFSQCGNSIKDLNTLCTEKMRSLQTSGASNGQTIAGVLGTGVHGSSIHIGSMQEMVYGLHIVNGTKPEDSIYLEAASHPVVEDTFAEKINATLVRNDDLFNAALVGLGAFGYVHGVMIKTHKRFLLRNFIKKVDISKVYEFMQSMDIQTNGLNIQDMDPDKLFHMKFYINQYRTADNVRAEIIYKYPEGRRAAIPVFLKYNKDFTLSIGKFLSGIFPFLIPGQIDKQLPEHGKQESGYLGDIFKETTNLRDGQFSCAIACEITDAEKLTKLMLDLANNHKKIPSTFSIRFVKKSKATMAFTKFNMNCLFGIDGIDSKATQKFLKKCSQALINSGIAHTWHWGKFNIMDEQFVTSAYGGLKTKWINERSSFFSAPIVANAFTNDYLTERGLS